VHGLQLLLYLNPGLASQVGGLLINLCLVLLESLHTLMCQNYGGDVFIGVFYSVEQAALR